MPLPNQLSLEGTTPLEVRGNGRPIELAERPDLHVVGVRSRPNPRHTKAKANGIHYTPPDLARFLAAGLACYAPAKDVVRLIDPACGAGELLAAAAETFGRVGSVELTGTDIDPNALALAQERLQGTCHPVYLLEQDFLESCETIGSQVGSFERFDAVISNPPYVRTQVLGGARAQELGRRFGLTGRVDLYQAFIKVMAGHLAPGGILALLCSNRFLSIQAGRSVREILRDDFEICEIVDLGDTKLFDAAVLPAIVFAKRRPAEYDHPATFIRAYEAQSAADERAASLVTALSTGLEGLVEAGGRTFRIERGTLRMGATSADPWTLEHDRLAAWMACVAERTDATLGGIATIRVGIKTTADRVFIRSDWDDPPLDQRPEEALLRPLITHHIARRWTLVDEPTQRVLYPHEAGPNGRQLPVELAEYPRAARYLEANRERLEGRSYVSEAGRRWYEVWVPQKPGEWSQSKIVFPDISEVPRFFLDHSGAIVNGDCYWITTRGLEPELVSLILAVANSTFSLVFYDAVCGNRLYAGRRRFITQYVKRFPIPKTAAAERIRVHELVSSLCDQTASDATKVEAELNEMVWHLFGLAPEEIPW